jgi:transposase
MGYRAQTPDGYRYSRFCELYQRWRRKQEVVLRQEHRAGEKLFVDYAGRTIPVQHPATGEIREAQLFVAVLGASNYTYAEASWTQGLGDWIGSHIRAFEFLDGVTEIVVPDNLKSGVTKSCRYEPGVNLTYEEMAHYYGVAVVPARPRKPRDKACASYCTLSRFDSGQDWLGCSTATMAFNDCGILERFIKRMVPAVTYDPAEEPRPRPFMHGRFGDAKSLAHLVGCQ